MPQVDTISSPASSVLRITFALALLLLLWWNGAVGPIKRANCPTEICQTDRVDRAGRAQVPRKRYSEGEGAGNHEGRHRKIFYHIAGR